MTPGLCIPHQDIDVRDFVRNVLGSKTIVEHPGTLNYTITSSLPLLISVLYELGMACFSGDSNNQVRDNSQGPMAKIRFSRVYRSDGNGIQLGESFVNCHPHHKCTCQLANLVKRCIIGKPHGRSCQGAQSKRAVSRPTSRNLKMFTHNCVSLIR